MSSVKLRRYHQLLVKGFHNVWAFGHSVDFVLCVCVHSVSLYWTTVRQGLCHPWLLPPSGSAIITSISTCLVSDSTWFLPGLYGADATQCSWGMFSYIPMQSLSSSSALTLLPQILFLMHFVLFSFNRWHRMGIWDAETQHTRSYPWEACGVEDRDWRLGRGQRWMGSASSMVTPWTSWVIPSQWEMQIKLMAFSLGPLMKDYLSPNGMLKPQPPPQITGLSLRESLSSAGGRGWGEKE